LIFFTAFKPIRKKPKLILPQFAENVKGQTAESRSPKNAPKSTQDGGTPKPKNQNHERTVDFMMNYNELRENYRQYLKTFDKYGIRPEEIASFTENGGKITKIHEYYEKSATARYFSSKPKTVETEEISGENYLNICTWIGQWLGVKVTGKAYTYCGYIPSRLTSTRPDGNARSVTIFKFSK
jgi:hypothetical protein